MPLIIYQRDIPGAATLAVWKATEPTAALEQRLVMNELEREHYHSIRLEKRKREWLTVRILLQLVARRRELAFLASGKPVLFPHGHISISHSGDLAGIVIAQEPVGLDIQGVDERIGRIRTKFCNDRELGQLSSGPFQLEQLTVIWSAKEAVFKYFGEQVDFADDIFIPPFHHRQLELKAEYRGRHGAVPFHLTNILYSGYHMLIATAEE